MGKGKGDCISGQWQGVEDTPFSGVVSGKIRGGGDVGKAIRSFKSLASLVKILLPVLFCVCNLMMKEAVVTKGIYRHVLEKETKGKILSNFPQPQCETSVPRVMSQTLKVSMR